MKAIIFVGRKCVGKSTSCDFAKDWFASKGLASEIVGFADPIRKMMEFSFHIPREQIIGSDEQKSTKTKWFLNDINRDIIVSDPSFVTKWGEPPHKLTVRELMQIVGTNLFRNCFHELIWEKILWNEVATNSNKVYLIQDGRRDTEIMMGKMIPDSQVYAVKLNRNLPRPNVEHSNESGVDKIDPELFDLVIDNNGSKEELRDKVWSFLETNFMK